MAERMMTLALQLLRWRTGSMSWHTHGWPGQLALLCSTDPGDRARCLANLKSDYEAFLKAQDLGKSVLFLRNAARMSPFATYPMAEVAAALCNQTPPPPEAVQQVTTVSRQVWSSWGQTKVVEDGNNVMRDLETRAVKSKKVGIPAQWDALRSRGVMEQHGRTQ
eukprot:2762413-Lingulodinium_polyedra.AAC.1